MALAGKPVARLARAGLTALPARSGRVAAKVYAVAAPMDMPTTEESAPRFEVRITMGEAGLPGPTPAPRLRINY